MGKRSGPGGPRGGPERSVHSTGTTAPNMSDPEKVDEEKAESITPPYREGQKYSIHVCDPPWLSGPLPPLPGPVTLSIGETLAREETMSSEVMSKPVGRADSNSKANWKWWRGRSFSLTPLIEPDGLPRNWWRQAHPDGPCVRKGITLAEAKRGTWHVS